MSELREFFDGHAAHWDAMERGDIGLRLERVVREAGVAPGMRVLDVGTGTGVALAALLAALGAAGRVHAIDISPGMLEIARAKGFPASVSFELCGLQEHVPADGPYDLVLCNAVFPHFDDKPAALRQAHALLKPGGRVVVSHPTGREAVNRTHSNAGGVIARDSVPGEAEMRALLEAAGFTAVSVVDEPEHYLARGDKPSG